MERERKKGKGKKGVRESEERGENCEEGRARE